MQTVVKKWFRERDTGFLDNGSGPDIIVNKDDLVNCQFLKVGVKVEFECHYDNRGLFAKNVKLLPQNRSAGQNNHGKNKRTSRPFRIGVMT